MRKRVAVIGAGPSGLVAARHLNSRTEEFECHVFEREENVGGTWRLSKHVGIDSRGLPVHSSMYKNLRTNLPKEIMKFPDFSFPNVTESYIKFELVLKYLEDYADHFHLRPLIKFNHLVTNVRQLTQDLWELEATDLVSNIISKSTFDAVMICNGRYSKPVTPHLPGSNEFQGLQIHSHDYRDPELFRAQRVLIIGAGFSGRDITMDLSECALQVVLSHHNSDVFKMRFPDNVIQVPDVECITSRGVVFKNAYKTELDAIIYCTGYTFNYPFLDSSCGVSTTERGVEPLYRHLVHLEKPSMCFMTLPNNVVPFPLADLQVRYFLAILDGSLQLPSREEMRLATEHELQQRRDAGMIGTRLAHSMGSTRQQIYCDELAHEAGIPSIPRVITSVHSVNQQLIRENISSYRDIRYRILDNENFEIIK